LKDVLPHLKRGVLDVMVEVKFKRRKYRGKRTTVTKLFRVVAVLNKETGDYHVYMTNIPVDRLSAEDIASLYGARWEIEMVFKELKSYYRMDQIDSANPDIIKSLIWVSILTLMCSRKSASIKCQSRKSEPLYALEMGEDIRRERTQVAEGGARVDRGTSGYVTII
jgi:IS4 transposase